jgi:small subunit ribosomal protein S8
MSQVSTDPIADMLTRIRNAAAVGKDEVNLPYSKLKQSIAELLKSSRYISSVKVVDASVGKTLVLGLSQNGLGITEIVRLSKPGRRMYTSASEIPVIKSGRGVVIISTSKGVMSGDQAKTEGIGGELICKVY